MVLDGGLQYSGCFYDVEDRLGILVPTQVKEFKKIALLMEPP
jgi:hypothetical protein